MSEPSEPGQADGLDLKVLSEWMAGQRWYAGKGHLPVLRRVGGWHRTEAGADARIEVVVAADQASSPQAIYQVPLTWHPRPLPGAESALVATTDSASGERWWVYDGPHDPAYVRSLLADVLDRDPDGSAPRLQHSSVLRGEQSNTSVICELEGTDPVIVKVFRTLAPGPNPDVEVPAGLAALGSRDVPASRGSAQATWAGAASPGYVACAQTFVPGVEDAWRVAMRAAADGLDFTGPARELGQTTARIHRDLARAFPTRDAAAADVDGLLASVRSRFAGAADSVPELCSYRADLDFLLVGLDGVRWPRLQRIHGDYHLGQVLHVPTHGWLAVDFEGEPLRPLEERVRPDLAMRDVAGMLRSFDYVAGSVEASGQGACRREWASACREAFLEGYGFQVAVTPDAERLLRVFELDKALYEVGYEARGRPSWVGIPVNAFHRLLHP